MDVLLTFVNQSEAIIGKRIVLFQKNHPYGDAPSGTPVAWRVLHISGQDTQQRIHVSSLLSVAAKTASGIACEQHLTNYNQRWDVINTKSSDWLVPSGLAAIADHVEVRNTMPREVITAQIYKDGRLLAQQSGVEPKTTVAFHFDNTLWLGLAADDIQEGATIPDGKLRFVTELSIEGLSKADLVLTNTGDEYKFRLVPIAQEAVLA